MENIQIIPGDSLQVLRTLEAESIDFCMTSPPYWGLRNYGVEGQLGLEPKFEDYINKLIDIFQEVKRVLKRTGSCYVNLGDTYSGSGGNSSEWPQTIEKNPEKWASRNNGASITQKTSVPAKTLIGIPERFYLRMIDAGWIPRNKIIWYKPNHMPSSVQDRLTNSYEFVYHFVKSKRYFYNLDKIREPWSQVGIDRVKSAIANQETFDSTKHKFDPNRPTQNPMQVLTGIAQRYKGKFSEHEDPESVGSPRARKMRKQDNVPSKNAGTYEGFNERWKAKHQDGQYGDMNERINYERNILGVPHDLALSNPFGKNPGDVWRITTRGHSFAHFAVFPLQLVYRPMISSSPPNGTCLDPFCGSGTVALMSEMLNRKFIGIELNPEYIKIAWKRINHLRKEAEILNKLIGHRIEQAGALDRFVEAV